jgi:oxygen-dependent protoporphyrinogen oxidase
MFSFGAGIQFLIDTLAERLNGSIRLQQAAAAVEWKGAAWQIAFHQGPPVEHEALLLCAPAHQMAQWLSSDVPELSWLREIRYPPIVRVVLGFKRDQVAHPLDGFGALIPVKEPFKSLGMVFSSSVLPNRAPQGSVSLTVFVGGARHPDLCDRSGQHALDVALSDARRLLGITGEPEFQNISFIPHSIPQYDLGYGEIKCLMDQMEQKSRGLFFAGNYRDGISVADSIVSGLNAAGRIAAFLQ